MIELLIGHGDKLFYPVVQDGIDWSLERKGVPGKLTFKVIYDPASPFEEGDPVRFGMDGNNLFYGYIFSKKRSKDNIFDVTAYDQLRYLKNKDCYIYQGKTASDVVKMLADDFGLKTGELENTGFVIPMRSEKDKTLFDIIQTALDITMQNTGKLFVLYDDFGKLTLKNTADMKLNLLIDETAAENYDYTTSIDGETYNQIKLTYDNTKTGIRDVYLTRDSANINQWGLLQYHESIDEKVNGQAKAEALLKLYNRKTRNLSIKNAFGDTRIRAGCYLPVILQFDDLKLQNYMLVEKVKHTFKDELHVMDLTLKGAGIDG